MGGGIFGQMMRDGHHITEDWRERGFWDGDGSVFSEDNYITHDFDIGSCVACQTDYGSTNVVWHHILGSESGGSMVEHPSAYKCIGRNSPSLCGMIKIFAIVARVRCQ